jgi:surface protein
LKNLINFRDSHIFSNINNLIQLNDFDFFNQMMNINYNINTPNIDELIISYKIDKNEPRIKLFSQNFFNNNKDKCYLLINGDKKDLIKEYEVNNFKDCILTIKLVGLKNITDISSMFRDCTSLLFIPNLSEINTFRFTNFSQIFYGCTSLASLPDISNWNTFNVKSFDYMFGNCPKLESLPDISKWNTMNTTDFTGMFYLCSSLKTMPDISKWNTSRVTSISYIFSGCTSLDLKEIKGISRWDTSSLIYATQMIKGCPGSLDDQSNFELSKTFGNFFNIFF